MCPPPRAAILVGMPGGEQMLCRLQYEAGRIEACPGERCPFWEEEGLGGEPGCAFHRIQLDLRGRPEVAHHLLRVRRALELSETGRERREALALFYRLID
jgi:hypothetical protein